MKIEVDFDGQFFTTLTDDGVSVTLRGCPHHGEGVDTPAAAEARKIVSPDKGVTIYVGYLEGVPVIIRPDLSPQDLAGIDAACREIVDTLQLTGEEVINVVPVTWHSEELIGPMQRHSPAIGLTYQWDDVSRTVRIRNALGEETTIDPGGIDYTAALD